tara:strand:- start:198 stop:542 length:345 start_codon:yes stop_codon:yes gene_type:complete
MFENLINNFINTDKKILIKWKNKEICAGECFNNKPINSKIQTISFYNIEILGYFCEKCNRINFENYINLLEDSDDDEEEEPLLNKKIKQKIYYNNKKILKKTLDNIDKVLITIN